MKIRLSIIIATLITVCLASIQAQTYVTGAQVRGQPNGPLPSGTWCFGSQCLPVSNGYFSGTVTPGTQTVTAKDSSGNLILSVSGVVMAPNAYVSWDTYTISTTQTYSGAGAPYLNCAAGSTYTQSDRGSAGWTCLSLPNGQVQWTLNSTGPPQPSGQYSGNGAPSFNCLAPCTYTQVDASPTTQAFWALLAKTGTASTNWVVQGSGGGGGSPTGPAGGDLGSNYPNPTVTQIKGGVVPASANVVGTNSSGQPVSATSTQVQNAIGSGVYDASGAAAARAGTGSCPTNQYENSDATGGPACAQVAYSQVTGTPSSLPPSGTASGDLSGSYPSPLVAGLGGISLPSPALGYLFDNGSNLQWTGLPSASINTSTAISAACGQWTRATSTSAITVTLPAPTAAMGSCVNIIERGISAGAISITTLGGTYDGASANLQQGAAMNLWTDGTNWHSSSPLVPGANCAWTGALTGNTINCTPGGSAGGDLSGTYPNPSVVKINGVSLAGLATGILKNTTSTGAPSIAVAGTDYAAANASTTVNSQPCALGGSCTVTAAPSGSAGGDLSGSYPNPGVAKINGTALSGLATGLLKNTTTTGVPSIATSTDVQNTIGAGVYDASGAAAARAGTGSCATNQYANATTTSGVTCAQVAYSQVSGTPSALPTSTTQIGSDSSSNPVNYTPTFSTNGGDLLCAEAGDTTISSKTITGGSSTSSTITVNAASTTGIYPGVVVTIAGASPSGFNIAQATVTSFVANTSITVSSTNNPGAWSSGGTVSLACANQTTDATTLNATQYFTASSTIPSSYLLNFTQSHLNMSLGFFTPSTNPASWSLWSIKFGSTQVFQNNFALTMAGGFGHSGSMTYLLNQLATNGNTAYMAVVPSGLATASSSAIDNYLPSPSFTPTAVTANTSLTVTFGAAFSATGVATATYVSGGTLSGTGNVSLATFNNSCTATASMAVTSGTAGAITITSRGGACTAAPTTATCTSGTATCSGTVTLTSTLGGMQGEAIQLHGMAWTAN